MGPSITTSSGRPLTHASMIQVGSEIWCYSTENTPDTTTAANAKYCVRLFTTTDGQYWVDHGIVLTPQPGTYYDRMCSFPGVIKVGSTYYMAFESLQTGHYADIGLATSSDGVNWSALEPVHINATPWHLDVHYIEGRSQYWMLFVDSPLAGSKLKLATSKDGLNWEVYPEPLLVPGLGWDDERIYRASFLYGDDGRFRVWYSARSRLGQWHVGYAETGQSSLFDSPGD